MTDHLLSHLLLHVQEVVGRLEAVEGLGRRVLARLRLLFIGRQNYFTVFCGGLLRDIIGRLHGELIDLALEVNVQKRSSPARIIAFLSSLRRKQLYFFHRGHIIVELLHRVVKLIECEIELRIFLRVPLNFFLQITFNFKILFVQFFELRTERFEASEILLLRVVSMLVLQTQFE